MEKRIRSRTSARTGRNGRSITDLHGADPLWAEKRSMVEDAIAKDSERRAQCESNAGLARNGAADPRGSDGPALSIRLQAPQMFRLRFRVQRCSCFPPCPP